MSNARKFDLARADDVAQREDQGQAVPIRDVQSGETLFTVQIAGTYSALYRRTQEAQTQRLIRKRQRELTTEQLTQHRVELVAACILGWDDNLVSEGKPVPFSRDNALRLARVDWIRDQLEEGQADHAGFFKGSSATS